MVAVFHRIGEPTPDLFTHSIDQITAYTGTITFDGVYESVFQHRIRLRGREALFFVSGDQIGREGFCNYDQLIRLRSEGHALGWHGWSHTPLTELEPKEIEAELQRPAWVEPVYAYPHGEFNDSAIRILQDMGYDRAYSTTQGQEGNRFAIPRFYIG